jgi:RHS repeat-associated protein
MGSGVDFFKRAAISIFFIAVLVSTAILLAVYSGWINENEVKLTPYGISVYADNAGTNLTGEVQPASNIFDNDTTTLYAPAQTRIIQFSLAAATDIKAIKVYGNSSYNITLLAQNSSNQWAELGSAGSSGGASMWNSYKVSNAFKSSTYRIMLQPVSGAGTLSGVAEIELWGSGENVNIKDGATLSAMLDEQDVISSGGKYSALPAQDSVTITASAGGTTSYNPVFTAAIPESPSSFKRAWLVYELNGYAGWISIEHTINGKGWKKAWPMASQDGWVAQVEPIDPDLLQAGSNTITFLPPSGSTAGYSIRNIRIVAEKDNGYNNINVETSGNTTAANLLDGDPLTSWKTSAASESIIFGTYRPVQADSLALNAFGAAGGNLQLFGYINGGWTPVTDVIDGGSLKNGWNNIAINTALPVSQFELQYTGQPNSSIINEADICGSGTGPDRSPGLEISYPDSGEYYGRAAYVAGFITVPDNGSGPAQVLVGPNQAVIKDGVFSGVASKEDVGLDAQADSAAWSVDVTLLYPDGTKIVKTIILNSMIGYDPNNLTANSTYGFGLTGGIKDFKFGNVELKVSSGDQEKAGDIQVVQLSDRDLPSLATGMVNVTGKKIRGYRFLPHHSKFKKKMTIKLPYEKSMLPAGKKDKDVKTYYFNDTINRWMPVELDHIDSGNQAVYSLTDHFTDFINATIVVPDHQQEQNFNPNQIKDLKAALPNAGITMIQPPSANSKGDAVLTYPIEVPPGRQGMQPDISIVYNSSAGDGLLGVGWDMPIRAVSCDTKWGVPRYDENSETESYLLDGEQLLPNERSLTFTDFPERDGSANGKRFYSKVEGKFLRILRMPLDSSATSNDSLGHAVYTPDNYYWEVVDKSGNISIYGYTPDSILTDESGHIFTWAISQYIDKNGNEIDYHYKTTAVYTNNKELLPDYILYGDIYKVVFDYDTKIYPKTDCRGGFLRNNAHRLQQITVEGKINPDTYEIGSNYQQIRKYAFIYENEKNPDGSLNLKFGKDRLSSILQYGSSDGSPITSKGHVFHYYDDVQGSMEPYSIFRNDEVTINTNIDSDVADGNVGTLNKMGVNVPSGPSALSGTLTQGAGETYGITGGVEIEFLWGKVDFSLDVKKGYDNSSTNNIFSFMDVDGDGLPDQMISNYGNNIFVGRWRKNIDGNGFETASNPLPTLQLSSKENDNTNYWGLGVGATFPDSGWGVSGSYTPLSGDLKQSGYMMDVNGDGIADLCYNNAVYFGKRNSDGTITYVNDASSTEVNMGPNCGLPNVDNLVAEEDARFINDIEANPLVATIKKWEAPYSGHIYIDGNVSLIQDNSLARQSYQTADGVRVSIQQNSNSIIDTVNHSNALMLCKRIISTKTVGSQQVPDYDVHDLHDLSDPANTNPLAGTITVQAGDRIYFRVQSLFDGAYDNVSWQPNITYLDKKLNPSDSNEQYSSWTDANYMPQAVYKSQDDFTLAGRRQISLGLDYKGTIVLSGDIVKQLTTDDVQLHIILTHPIPGTSPVQYTTTELNAGEPNQSLAWNKSGTITMGTDTDNMGNHCRRINVDANDMLSLFVDCDSNIDIHKLSWAPVIYYEQTDGNVPPAQDTTKAVSDPARYQITFNGLYDIQFYPKNAGGIENREYVVKIPVLDTVTPPVPQSSQTLALRVKGRITKSAGTTQDVRISLLLNSTVNPDGTVVDGTGTSVDVALIPKDVTGTAFSLPTNLVYLDTNNPLVWPVTSVRIIMTTGNNADMQTVTWSPELTYVIMDSTGNIVNETIAAEQPMPYEANLVTDKDQDPTTVDTKWIRNMYARPRFKKLAWLGDPDPEGNPQFGSIDYIFTVKKYGAMQGKGKTTVSDAAPVGGIVESDIPVGDVMPGDKLFFECFTKKTGGFTDPDLTTHAPRLSYDDISSIHPEITDNLHVHIPGVRSIYFPVNPRFEDEDTDLFATPYRGWAYAGLKEVPACLQPGFDFNAAGFASLGALVESDGYKTYFISPDTLIDESKLSIKNVILNSGYSSSNNNIDLGDIDQIMFMPTHMTDGTDDAWKAIPTIYGTYRTFNSSRMIQEYIGKLSRQDIINSLSSTRSIGRWSKSSQNTGSLSGSYTFPIGGGDNKATVGAGASVTWGTGYSVSDYMDMNGDGFPDLVSTNDIEYTKPNGGLSCWNYSLDHVRENSTKSFGGTLSAGIFNPGVTKENAKLKGLSSDTFAPSVGLNANAGITWGTASSTFELIDINGDGLPDKVWTDANDIAVEYNTGYGFTDASRNRDLNYINESSNSTTSMGGGVSVEQIVDGWGGGLFYGNTGSMGTSNVTKALVDVNGDGLPDILQSDGKVRFNTGSGFTTDAFNVGLPSDGSALKTQTVSAGTNAGGYGAGKIPLPWPGLFATFKLSYSKDWNNTMSKQKSTLMDFDGDGYPDWLYIDKNISDQDTTEIYSSFQLQKSHIGRTNLLKQVNMPMGGTILMDYSRSPHTTDSPKGKWNMTTFTITDGVAQNDMPDRNDNRIINILYTDPSTGIYSGKYDKAEREFLGHRFVTEVQTLDNFASPAVKRYIKRKYNVDGYSDSSGLTPGYSGYYTKNLLMEEDIYGSLADYQNDTAHYRKIYQYAYDNPAVYDIASDEISYAPLLIKSSEEFYENKTGPVTKTEDFAYDAVGNIVKYARTGSETGDTALAEVNYKGMDTVTSFTSSLLPSTGPLNLPQDITVSDGTIRAKGPNILRNRHAKYDSKGNVTEVIQHFVDENNNRKFTKTSMAYDSFGNITKLTMPPTHSVEHSQAFTFVYDDINTNVISVANADTKDSSLEYSSSSTFDYRWEKAESSVDVNGNAMTFAYDEFGRLMNVQGPNETTAGQFAVKYYYYPDAVVPCAVSKNRDMINGDDDPIKIVTFTDGLGNVIQTKKDAKVNGVDKMVVSGMVYKDNGGRVLEEHFPTVEDKTTDISMSLDNAAGEGNLDFEYLTIDPRATVYNNDNFDRETYITYPDSTNSSITYNIDSGRLEKEVTDANGNKTATYTDADGKIYMVNDHDTKNSKDIATNYNYDNLGEIINVTQKKTVVINSVETSVNLVTGVTYDMLGRRTSITNPDTGTVTMGYDLASNLISKQTARLTSSTAIQYVYDELNRLTQVNYASPDAGNSVSYVYGNNADTAKNQAARIKTVTFGNSDGSNNPGKQDREYDKLGNITKQTDTIAGQAFTTSYTWDDLGRMINMTYPGEGEKLTYAYDSGGLVSGASSVLGPLGAQTYVNSITYDMFGKRLSVTTGSTPPTISTYAYDTNSQRLVNLVTSTGGSNVQNLTYTYDSVGNILTLTNDMNKTIQKIQVPEPAKEEVYKEFSYDGFNRLTNSSGRLKDMTSAPSTVTVLQSYTVAMQYDEIHNITSKDQAVCASDIGGGNIDAALTYANNYSYNTGATQPHAPAQIGNCLYKYDASGNMTQILNATNNSNLRDIVWNAENRITQITDHEAGSPDVVSQYWYNDAGNRVTKLENGVQTIYPNQYQSLQTALGQSDFKTRNIYIANQRLASVVTVGSNSAQPYYYVTDNLGSTAYLTDSSGNIAEHIEYTPWGESWWENSFTSNLPVYKFTGKEEDITQLYYFGARYYDPMTSIWQSPDPILDKYLDAAKKQSNSGQNGYGGGTVEKGVFDSMNLALYSYGYQNPVRMIDPDGNEVNPDNPDYWGSHGNEYHPAPEIKMPNNDLGNPSNGGTQLPGYAVQYQEGNRDKLIGATLSLGVDIASEFSKKIDSIISNVITPALDLQSGASMLDVGKNRLLGMIPGYSIGKDLIDIGANSGRFVPYMGPTATPDTTSYWNTGTYDFPATATIGFTPVTPAFTVTPNRNNIRY